MKNQPDVNEQVAEIGRQIAKTTANWEAALEPIAKRFVDIQNDLQVAVKKITLPAINIQKAFEAAFAPLGEQIVALQKSFKPFLESLSQALEQLPEKNKAVLMILAENGWYLDPDCSLSAMVELVELFASGNVNDANNALCDHFESRADEIESNLTSELPERSRIFLSAFEAHRRTDYALSIPVFLAQADGICHKITGEQLYSKDSRGIPRLASVLLTPEISPFAASMLAPIIEPAPITANAKAREQVPNILNRHAVLHGESTDYDNRLNSCRAISLLVYVAWILRAKE
jgi:hypothetical protein